MNTPVLYAQLATFRSAIRLEQKGMKHSSGKSARARACNVLQISDRTPAHKVLVLLQERMDEILKSL